MSLQFYNTMGRSLQEFTPLVPGKAGFYACGPTVYNYAHIGNLRTYIFEDILRRVLEYNGLETTHVMNITDVGHLTDDADDGEDKMEKSARETGRTVWDIADFYTRAFFEDTEKLNILKPHIICRATDHIEDMIGLIRRLEDRGCTYSAQGNLYFDISRFPDYGKLALLDRQKLQAGARIEVDANKKNPQDFVLWFTNSKFENQAMVWDSPWGRGYPGWHVECSAMSMKYLGETFDIHTGGVDHIPIHHTNEIAQSEGATGKTWVRYWLHGEFLLLKNAKMSKSSGGFLTLSSLEEMGYHPLDYRYFCLGGHYRSQLVFSEESLSAARTARRNLNERVLRLKDEVPDGPAGTGRLDEPAGLADPAGLGESPGKAARERLRAYREDINRDLGIPQALAELWGILKDPELTSREKLALSLDLDRVLGLRLGEPEDREPREDLAGVPAEEIQALIDQRNAARKEKDFARADAIRDDLAARGIIIKDTPGGTTWEPAAGV